MTGSWDASVFERLYAESPDPWGFETSAYEREKYAATLDLLGTRHFRSGLELGCSIGVMTEALAPRCTALLAVDIAEAAIDRARERCRAQAQLRFLRATLPAGFPDLPQGSCDLIVISELLYFLGEADIAALAGHVLHTASPDALVLLANWTGETDTPCTGDQAVAVFDAAATACGLRRTRAVHREQYRLDLYGF